MNNKGFTLIETLCVVVVISFIIVLSVKLVGNTLALSENESYEIVKNNIISVSKTYILECDNGIISCDSDYEWNNDSTSFLAFNLIKYGYLNNDELVNPINGNDLSNCLIINAYKENGNIVILLEDDNC